MNAREVVHRGGRWVTQNLERALVRAGWAPTVSRPVGPGLSLFPSIDGWQEAWAARYSLDTEGLEMLMAGRISFFGHTPLEVGMPVDWHRDPLTGVRSPQRYGKALNYRDPSLVGNVKLVWELGRHQHLIPLAVAYACSGERRYRDAVVAQIEGWIKHNPYGVGIHWCSSLELALRLISWAVVHSLLTLRDGEEGLFVAVGNRRDLGLAIHRQARFVRGHLSRYSSANNHLIGELTGLWIASRVFDLGAEGDCWADQAQRELEREALSQVHDDGVDKEQAFYYHLWVLEYLLLAWLTGRRCGCPFSDVFRDRIVAMAEFLHAVTPRGGQPPQIGDSDDGFVTRFQASWPHDPYHDVLAAVDRIMRPGASGTSSRSEKAFWYALIAGGKFDEHMQGPATATSTRYPAVFRHGGYAVLGGDGVHLVFDAGPLGYPEIAAHGHADALSFCLALDGVWWLVDPGTYAYHGEPCWRDYFRGTAAHNTLVVDGRNQSQMGGPFLWLRQARGRIDEYRVTPDGRQVVSGSHDGYKDRAIMHHRTIEFKPSDQGITVRDLIDGHGVHDLALYYHFAPEVKVEPGQEPDTWIATRGGSSAVLSIQVDSSWHWAIARGAQEPKLGWYSPALGVRVAAHTLYGRKSTTAPVQVVAHLNSRLSSKH